MSAIGTLEVDQSFEPAERLAIIRSRLVWLRAECARIGSALRREERAMRPGERAAFESMKHERELLKAEAVTLGAALAD